MALHDYSVKHHPAGAKCIRVTGPANQQVYFPQHAKSDAKLLDQRFKQQTTARRKRRFKEAKPRSRRNPLTATSFEGIRLGLQPPRGERGECSFYLSLQVTSESGEMITRSRVIHKDTLPEKWDDLVKILAKAKGYSRIPGKWLTRPMPTTRQCNQLAAHVAKTDRTARGFRLENKHAHR